MKKHSLLITVLFLLIACGKKENTPNKPMVPEVKEPPVKEMPKQYTVKATKIFVDVETTMGVISVELYPDKAPITVSNFLKYVDNNRYDDGYFFRVLDAENQKSEKIKIEVVQARVKDDSNDFPPIKLETTKNTGLRHKHGTISMARLEPDTATNSFFITINDQPDLDFGGQRNPDGQGFAAFGQVIKGMDVVTQIQNQKEEDTTLIKPVIIKTVKRVK